MNESEGDYFFVRGRSMKSCDLKKSKAQFKSVPFVTDFFRRIPDKEEYVGTKTVFTFYAYSCQVFGGSRKIMTTVAVFLEPTERSKR
jgi:hypothetical protein